MALPLGFADLPPLLLAPAQRSISLPWLQRVPSSCEQRQCLLALHSQFLVAASQLQGFQERQHLTALQLGIFRVTLVVVCKNSVGLLRCCLEEAASKWMTVSG